MKLNNSLVPVKLELVESVVSAVKFGIVVVSLLADSTVELSFDALGEKVVGSNG